MAIVTGGAGGIATAIVKRFAEEGASVLIAEVNLPAAEQLAAELSAAGANTLAHRVDITNEAEVKAMFAAAENQFGGVDILVNNAFSKQGDTTITELTEEAWDYTINATLKGPFLCTKHVLPLMKQRGGGSVVSISSVNALRGVGDTAYTAAKGGLVSMMRLVASEYGEWNVRSNVICPGTIETHASMSHWERFPAGFEALKRMYPLGRIGQPADVAEMALFLASDESRWVTGTVQVVDGGLMAGNKLEVE